MKKWALVFLPVIAIGIFVYGFWSLGTIPEPVEPLVTLRVEQSGVQVKAPNTEQWQEGTSGMILHSGWSVKTDNTGLASIRFFGQGESRLFHNTEVVITNASYAGMTDAPESVSVQVDLLFGRVWSRVLKLLDVEAQYEVKASDVVATVRGTAFDVSKNGDNEISVIVNESAVTVIASDKESIALAEGRAVLIDSSGRVKRNERLSDELRMSDWFLKNTLADEQFVESEYENRLSALRTLDGPSPDSFLSGVASLSEKVHLFFASNEQKELLAERYLARQFMHLIDLVNSGKTGLSAQEFARLENYIRTSLTDEGSKVERERILRALNRIQFLVDGANPDDALYPFKQRIEKLREMLVQEHPANRFYARLLVLDTRLDEALRLMVESSWDDARIALDGVRNGIDNVARELSEGYLDLGSSKETIMQKHKALDARERVLRDRLEYLIEASSQVHTTSTAPSILDVLPEGEEGLDAGNTEDAVSVEEYTGIELLLSKASVEIGDTIQLSVLGIREDGSSQEITALSTFSLDQSIGRMNGPTFIGVKPGKATIKAQYRDGNSWRIASARVEVTGEVFIEELIITPMAGAVLKPGQSTRLRATVKYNDGSTIEVTDKVLFVQASGRGSLEGAVYTAMNVDGDTSEIAASYAENQRTVVGTVTITTRE